MPKTQLTSLELSRNSLGCENPEDPWWRPCRASDKGIKALAAVLPKTQLTHLNLWNNSIDADTQAKVKEALKANKAKSTVAP